MTILDEIIEYKKQEVEKLKQDKSLEEIKKKIEQQKYQTKLVNFENNKLKLIAEVKRKSPSKGIIRKDFDPIKIAREFDKNGASAISVLTDEKYFGGNPEFFKQVREITNLPLLRKDFIVDYYQVYETKMIQADIILLIAKSLKNKLEEFAKLSLELELQILIEVHNQEELENSLEVIHRLSTDNTQNKIFLGINNRNLETFETTLQNSLNLKKLIPEGIKTISESGIFETTQLKTLQKEGFNGVLIGEGLAKNPELLEYFNQF